MNQHSTGRHCRTIHQEEIVTQSVCADEQLGIFVVTRSSKGGVNYPIHVKKLLHQQHSHDNIGVFCKDESCSTYMEVAQRSRLRCVECRHLQLLGNTSKYPKIVPMNENDLWDLSHNGQHKLLKIERIKEWIELKNRALDTPAVVPFNEDGRFRHFSVYDGSVSYYSKLGRVIVTITTYMDNSTMDCRCCQRKRSCVHKAMCLWHLRSYNQLDAFRGTSTQVQEDFSEVQDSK